MGQLEDLKVFIEVVDNHGISRAAEKLHLAKSAVSRRLRRLEEKFEVRLIDRPRGHWEITAAGHEMYQRAVRLVSDSEELEADFKNQHHMLEGPLSVSVPREFGLVFLRPTITRFVELYPEIRLTVDFDDRLVDLASENYDLAIRITESLGHGLIERKLGVSNHALYASPKYVKKHGLPKNSNELDQYHLLHYGSARRAQWVFSSPSGKTRVSFQPTLNSNSGPYLLDATLSGLGIARLPDFIASESYSKGDLVLVLPELKVAEWQISLVHTVNRQVNRRMRAFADIVEAACLSL
ncbi:MAG: LysR family transcriptional regulator [Pseudomonadota bacterium]